MNTCQNTGGVNDCDLLLHLGEVLYAEQSTHTPQKLTGLEMVDDSRVKACEQDRKQEVLETFNSLDIKAARLGISLIFDVLRDWWAEYGPSKELLEAACHKLDLDLAVGMIYLQCPELISMMEALRRGVPVRRVKAALSLSDEARQWWHALLIVRVLLKCGGVVSHTRLLRWLGRRADTLRIREALDLLKKAKLVETYHVKGRDPFRPVTWHRLTLQAAP